MGPGKSLEKEPILGHFLDHLRHGEQGALQSGRHGGNMGGNVEKQETRALAPWSTSHLSIPRAETPEHLTVRGEKPLTLTCIKENRGCQQPRHIWQGPTQHGGKPVERGCQAESGSRAP